MALRRIGQGAALALALAATGCVTLQDTGQRRDVIVDAGAQVHAPAWHVGDRWSYSDGYGLEVEAVDGELAWFRRADAPEQWLSRRGFLRQDAQSATTKRSVVFRSIPTSAAQTLALGQPIVFTREFKSNDVTRIHSTSWMFEGRERVSVPAGDFEAYVIVMRTRNPDTGWTGFERWWYAPEVRHYVRMEYRYGEQPVGSRVLTSFALAGAAEAAVQKPPAMSQPRAAENPFGQSNADAPASASQGPKGSSADTEAASLAAFFDRVTP